MTIRRQYSLPNCTLIIEGIGDPSAAGELRPLMTTVLSFSCQLSGQPEPLQGGYEVLQALLLGVSSYAQGFLSGLQGSNPPGALVRMARLGPHTHGLRLQQADTPQEVTLSTVQLFDLVEAFDQLLADRQTLPDLHLDLKPRPRHQVRSLKPTGPKVVPAGIGIASVILAALLLHLLPVPKVPVPKVFQPQPVATRKPA